MGGHRARCKLVGGTPDEPTCKTRAGAKATRIDAVLANQWAVPYINQFRVYKDEQIPTHAVLELTLENKNEQEESTYVRTLPSLQKLFAEEMQKRGEGKNHKEQQELRKEELTKLKGCMDSELLHRTDTFQKHKENEDTDA